MPSGYVSVAVPTPLRQTFQYRVPREQSVEIGWRVRVPFGNRRVVGIVTSLDAEPHIESKKIREIAEVLDPAVKVDESIFGLCRWAADYYCHPIGEVFATALPTLVRTGKEPRADLEALTLTDTGRQLDLDSLNRAPAQRRVIDLLSKRPLTREELAHEEVTRHVITSLYKKELVTWEPVTADEKPAAFKLTGVDHGGVTPTPAQAAAVSQISAGGAATTLLYGVTGSGKTEVYLRLIEDCLKAGKQAMVLVPEIGLTPQTISRFKARFDVEIAVLHSGMTDKERATDWMNVRNGEAGVIIGTRSAVFTPMRNPGLIIVDEEHDASFKQSEGFHYSARDLAVMRGSREKVPVVLGSATPSLESFHNAEVEKYHLVKLAERPAGVLPEKYRLVDTGQVPLEDGLSKPLTSAIQATLDKGQQVLVFINRRGFAPVLFCNTCGWIARCHRCDAKLTYHLGYSKLICHHCGSEERNHLVCQSCKSKDLAALGQGTQRIEQVLANTFRHHPILRIDRDSTRRKGSLDSILDTVATGEPAILVGTQLLAKGHHFPSVTLVAILDIDAGFYSADFRSIERTGQMVLQVGGRSGRAQFPGEVMIQTAFAGHPLLQALIREGYDVFAQSLMQERRDAHLPPYRFHALIRASSQDRDTARIFLEEVSAYNNSDRVELLGPVPALMEKRAGRFRQLLLFSSDSRSQLLHLLKEKVGIASALPRASKVRWSVDVDPYDLF